jgi:N-acetyl-1-D-myo-inositol-2-amino-2-deoxy-alpha-D-glucopyranoside deacetylase
MSEPERVLFVHAHPDDESLSTGGTIARLTDNGAWVTVVTCTRGELGSVVPDELEHLRADPEALGAQRETEIAAALRVLGVSDHRYLGASDARWPGRPARQYRDSGMVWGAVGAQAPAAVAPDSLTGADFGEVAADIAAVIADVHPSVVVSYNENGGYGHPDHIRAHQAARRAAEVYGVPFFVVEPVASASQATVDIDVSDEFERKRSALASYRTQGVVEGERFVMADGHSVPISAIESYRRVHIEQAAGTPFAKRSWRFKIALSVLTLIAGFGIGALLTVFHQASVEIGGVPVSVGLIVSLVLMLLLLVGLRLVTETRVVAGCAAIGILVADAITSLPTSGGSVLVPNNFAGYAWTYGPVLIALLVLGWPRVKRAATAKIGTSNEVKGSLNQ